MSAPFFSVWWLRDLHFNYLALALIASSTIMGTIVSCRSGASWPTTSATGQRCAWPAFWSVWSPCRTFFTRARAVLAINFVGGVCWAGYNLVSFNHLLSASENKDRQGYRPMRPRSPAWLFSMTLLGGFLATRLPVVFTRRLQGLFLLSVVVRLLTFSFFSHGSTSTRAARPERARPLNEIPGYRLGLGLLRNFFRALAAEPR